MSSFLIFMSIFTLLLAAFGIGIYLGLAIGASPETECNHPEGCDQ